MASKKVIKKSPQVKDLKKEKMVVRKKTKPVFSPPNLYSRLGISLILGVLMVGGIIYFVGKLKAQVSQIEEKRSQMTVLLQKGENFKKLNLDLDKVKEEIPQIEEVLVTKPKVIDFLSQVGVIEEKAEVTVTTISFTSDQPRVNEKSHHYLETVIKADGSSENLEKFVQDLFSLPVLMEIKVFDIAGLDEGSSQMVLKVWLYADPNFSGGEKE